MAMISLDEQWKLNGWLLNIDQLQENKVIDLVGSNLNGIGFESET